ncbi:MAG: hypothetical protein IJY67_03445 [Paludibacteraceae bacterium]|nr:hypothetical protein [Paludibacteraceae bacterium]
MNFIAHGIHGKHGCFLLFWIRFFAMQITPFCRDFVHAQHNSSKLGSAFAYRKNYSF